MTDVRRLTLGGGRTLEVEVDPDLPGFTAGRVLRAEGSVQLWTFESFGARVFDLDGEPLEVRFDPGGGIYAMWQGKRIEPDAPSWVKWGFALSTGAAGAVLLTGARHGVEEWKLVAAALVLGAVGAVFVRLRRGGRWLG